MDSALERRIEEARTTLDAMRPLSTQAIASLQTYFDVELTYTSNAIEGNTLTYRETAEVIEHGITVGGKPIRDHLEALDHYDAIQWIRGIASGTEPLGERIVTELHRRIVLRSNPDIAGFYSQHGRRVMGSPVIFPNAVKIPVLMERYGGWLSTAPMTPQCAFDAHFRLTAIHPFSDGNGRTARLLMNMMLIRAGYPPVAVRPEDRPAYIASLEHGSLAEDLGPFYTFLGERLLATLNDYVGFARESLPPPT